MTGNILYSPPTLFSFQATSTTSPLSCLRRGLQRLPKQFQYYTDYPPEDDFELFSALEPYYHVIERIFDFLDYRDLRKCCLVNKYWKEVAERTLAKRCYVTWFTCYKGRFKPQLVHFEMREKFWHNNVGCVVILFNSRRISLSNINFGVWSSLRTELPPAIAVVAMNCPSVVSHFNSDFEDVNLYGIPSVIDGFFIPKIPNIKTVMFQCDKKCENIKHIDIEPDDELKCLVIFATRKSKSYLLDLLGRLVPEKTAKSIAVGGGIVRNTNSIKASSNGLGSSENTFCIAFLKNKNLDVDFDAYSVVIKGHIFLEAEIEEKLIQFKSRITMRKQAFAVRICCNAKLNQKEEMKIFIRLFPDIPILGFTALGEIGWDCFGSSENEDGEIERKRRKLVYADLVYHEWSTVFVLVTWGLKRTV